MPVVAISADVCPAFDGPCQDLVDTLRKLLQKAEAGDLQSFMGAGFAANGDRVSMHGGYCWENVWAMQGALYELLLEYNQSCIE